MRDESGLTEQLTIRSFDVDWRGALKLQSLFQYFQEIAGTNATALGVGYTQLRTLGLYWVLARIRVEVSRLPLWGEGVELSTWPKGVDRLFALRDFLLRDHSGSAIIRGTSAWLLVDEEKGRPQRFDVLPADIRHYRGEDAIPGRLDKLQIAGPLALHHQRAVMPGDLDVNGHVNNAVYVGWVMDCFSPEKLQGRVVRRLEVNSVDEVRYGDIVAVTSGTKEGMDFEIEVVKKPGDATVLQAKVSFVAG